MGPGSGTKCSESAPRSKSSFRIVSSFRKMALCNGDSLFSVSFGDSPTWSSKYKTILTRLCSHAWINGDNFYCFIFCTYELGMPLSAILSCSRSPSRMSSKTRLTSRLSGNMNSLLNPYFWRSYARSSKSAPITIPTTMSNPKSLPNT